MPTSGRTRGGSQDADAARRDPGGDGVGATPRSGAGFETTEAARAFVESADLKEAMQRAGVAGQPRIEIFEEVEAIEY